MPDIEKKVKTIVTDNPDREDLNSPVDYDRYVHTPEETAGFIPDTEKGTPGGVATLGADGKLPEEQKPQYTAAEITNLETITNLTNYYRKSETYTQTEVNNLISAIPKLSITVVEELPAVGDPTKIYVIGNKEYLWLAEESRYEQFGDLSVDLSNYYTKSQVDTALADKVDKVAGKGLSENDLTNALKSGYDDAVTDKHTHSNKAILDATTASFLTAEKSKLTDIQAGAQVNVKSDWNAASGDAEILNKPAIPSAYTLPTASDIVKGGVKIGAGLEMDGEVLNATGGGAAINVEVLGDWS